jgi:hypothetical protein
VKLLAPAINIRQDQEVAKIAKDKKLLFIGLRVSWSRRGIWNKSRMGLERSSDGRVSNMR